MSMSDPLQEQPLKRLYLYFCLIPWLGTIPALWAIYHKQGDREQQALSRLVVTLAFIWLVGSGFLWASAAQSPQILQFRLLFGDALLGSGYAIALLFLMVRVWRRQSLHLPGFSQLSHRVLPK
ncbi:MAG: hypothetical protein SAJ11_00225 [Jaaginema sp. PMC 1078.18]|nr:hypothetical protein [Jaaginema sp. PMC 1078.18]